MNRRTFLAIFFATPLAAPLAGCNTDGTPIMAPATFLADLSAAVAGVRSMLANPLVASLVPAGQAETVADNLTLAQSGLATVTAVLNQSPRADLSTLAGVLQEADTAIRAVLAVLSGIALPDGLGPILMAVSTVLDLIEPTINAAIVKAFGTQPVKVAAAFPGTARMTADQARATLRGL